MSVVVLQVQMKMMLLKSVQYLESALSLKWLVACYLWKVEVEFPLVLLYVSYGKRLWMVLM